MVGAGLSLFKGQATRETLGTNVSCGVVWIPPTLHTFWDAWENAARWLVAHRDLMGKFAIHVDQVAVAMALQQTTPKFRHLPAQTNAILELLPSLQNPYALHLTSGHIPKYPDWFDSIGRLNID